MDSARIAALLEPFLDRPFAPAQLEQISTYIDLLLRWNARINLTAIRNPEEIVTRHFGESFFMASRLFPRLSALCHAERSDIFAQSAKMAEESKSLPRASRGDPYFTDKLAATQQIRGSSQVGARSSQLTRVLDLGSGAGFPALPLKIWAPHIHLTLIESNHKKAAFLREVARALTLTDVDVFAERAETLSARPEFPKADVVTFRAVENFDRTLPLAATFLAPHARLALLITTAQLPKLQPAKFQPTKPQPSRSSKPKPVSTVKPMPTLYWRTTLVPQSRTRMLSIGEQQ